MAVTISALPCAMRSVYRSRGVLKPPGYGPRYGERPERGKHEPAAGARCDVGPPPPPTAAFGNLKPGTGLLLDMGRPVTITSAQIMLGAMAGADFQLRGGGEPVLADLQPVASATGAGGLVTMRPARPAKARYLLLWFTRLPPDSSGTFEVIVYDVRLHGMA